MNLQVRENEAREAQTREEIEALLKERFEIRRRFQADKDGLMLQLEEERRNTEKEIERFDKRQKSLKAAGANTYIATKPDMFGIKFWVAGDLKSKYICNVLPYLGKDPSCPSGERLSENVVMRLMEPFLDKGRNVTMDNFFTSLSLAHKLLSRKTTILCTVNKIRREIPQSARHTDRNEFTTQVFSTTAATLTAYAPKRKKTVYILSSMHSVIQTDNTTKRKPNTVTLYNTTKCSVDVMDQMVQEYTVHTGTRRWPVAVFHNMIDMAALNAHVLYQACTGRQERRVDFLVELARELANSRMCAKKARKEQLLRTQPSTPSPGKRASGQTPMQEQSCHCAMCSLLQIHTW
ncbi:piggyBac transposable element-derived protein 4-like [Tachysurus fulvidraco]|uniref:piggyBac transposable element-derived protein 4-like n=1 Tax=Tachysurus fulvidraco TaxID=1234273 RepID=UPI001FEEE856|nr:piggyBac transposable element-derived protein 4-like [Tachysurus fulvidraco]